MPARKYLVYDVFTQHVLAGNQLAVVIDCDHLETAAMQAIAREFNLSETVFVLPATAEGRIPIRIFTPAHELPFAGHPTVGTAVALTELKADPGGADADILVLDEKIGPVRCIVERRAEGTFAEFTLAKLPQTVPSNVTAEGAAAALGLDPQDIGFDNHVVGTWNAGMPYVCVPVRDLDAAGRASLDTRLWMEMVGFELTDQSPAAYVYCRQTVGQRHSFHARMFAGHLAIPEDPATGSAAASLAGAIVAFERPGEGATRYHIEQGIEMGRPSLMRLDLDIAGGSLVAARLGGYAVKVAEGVIHC